jgi:transcriptional activator SPT7
VQDLERYISDDVERYGTRLGDLEKKLVGAYREVVRHSPSLLSLTRILISAGTFFSLSRAQTAVDVLSDEGLFEDEEEDGGALTMCVSLHKCQW